MGGACSTHESDEKCIYSFSRTVEEKRPLGRRRHRWRIVLKLILKK